MVYSSARIAALLLLSCLSSFGLVRASDTQAWVDVTDFFELKTNFQIGGITGYQTSTHRDRLSSFFFRPTLAYEFNRTFSLWGGVAFAYTWEPLSVLETRPWIGLLLRYPEFSRVSFSHYVRLEERIFDFEALDELLKVTRFRYKFKAVVPLNRPIELPGTWYIPVYLELATRLWGDLPTGFVSGARFSLGIGYHFAEHWRVELNYHIQQEKLTPGGEFTIDEHVIRLQFRGS